MNAFYNVLLALSLGVMGYLIGAIPTGVIIGKVFFHKDPRKEGSHGSGGTNSSRVLGKKVGVIVITLDILKTVAVLWIAYTITAFSPIKEAISIWDNGVFYIWFAVFCCAIGHCYPVYIGFKGGKAVACFMGSSGGASYVLFALDFIVFFTVYKIGKKKNIVSFASIISSLILVLLTWALIIIDAFGCDLSVLSWNLGFAIDLCPSWEEGIFNTLIALLLIYRHRENIVRLKSHKEKPYNLFGK